MFAFIFEAFKYFGESMIKDKRQREYYLKNKKALLEKAKKYYLENKEKILEWQKVYQKKYYSNNPKKHQARNKLIRDNIKYKVFSYYGLSCAWCGQTNQILLTIDHIKNDGSKHRKEIGSTIYRWLIRNNMPEGFQTLCYNCNSAKGKGYSKEDIYD